MSFGSAFDRIPEPEPTVPLAIDTAALQELVVAQTNAIAELQRAVIRLTRAVAILAAPRTKHVYRDQAGNIERIEEE